MTKPSRRRWVGRILSIALFSGAAWMLAAELRHHPLPALLAALRAIPPLRIGVSLVATALGYTALTGYDLLSLRYLGRRIPGRTVAFASFIGFAFANSLPFSLVTGASVRYRLYSDRGLSVADTTQLVALNTVTYVVGLLATAGVAFALQPILVPGFLRLPLHTARPLGVLCLLVVAAYLGWSAIGREPIRLGKWRLPAPNLPRAAAQVLVSGLDWTLSGTALYLLLPSGLDFTTFLGVFLLGQIAALVAQVPGGLGVFEAVVLWWLKPAVQPPAIFSALAAYRVIYFLLPLAIASVLWGGREARRWVRRRRHPA